MKEMYNKNTWEISNVNLEILWKQIGMNGLKSILKEAIKNKELVVFFYNNKKRIVEPYHYGILNEKEQLHCFQIAGETNSVIPQWKNFTLLKIMMPKIDKNTHFSIRRDYNPDNSHYSYIAIKTHN